jgi:hypothetical protein
MSEPVPWKWSLAVAVAAAHGPFALMALYALLAVPCDHCKAASVLLLPVGPGLLASHVLLAWSGIGRLDDLSEFILGAAGTVAFEVAVGSAGRLGRRWLYGSAAAAFVISALEACMLLALIRA